MNKFYSIILVLGITAFVGCEPVTAHLTKSDDYIVDEGNQSGEIEWIDEPIVWPTETDFDSYVQIQGVDERFDACQVPEDILGRMTTQALVKSILHFPLNYNILAQNNPIRYVKILFNQANVYQELAGRADAADEMVARFAITNALPLGESRVHTDGDYYENLTLFEERCFEYILGSGMIKGISSEKNKPTLTETVSRKLEEREKEKVNGRHVWSVWTDSLITIIINEDLDISLPEDIPPRVMLYFSGGI